MQERRKCTANELEIRLSYTNPSICTVTNLSKPGPVSLRFFFACNSNSMETSPCHNSAAGHQIAINFHRIWIAMAKPLVKLAPGSQFHLWAKVRSTMFSTSRSCSYIQDTIFVISVLTDAPVPNGARPSACTMLTTKSQHVFCEIYFISNHLGKIKSKVCPALRFYWWQMRKMTT